MHPYQIKEFADERTASKLREARHHELVAEARTAMDEDEPRSEPVPGGRGLRIPFLNWELRMQPVRPARAGR